MPEKKTMERARKDKREGKAPSTQAGEFVKEEIHHVREGKHGAKSTKQAIAIGLSKARRAGVELPARGRKASSRKTRSSSGRSSAKGRSSGKQAASHEALSRQAKSVASRRSKADRTRAAKKAARTRKRTQK
jgi:hypothetical protein